MGRERLLPSLALVRQEPLPPGINHIAAAAMVDLFREGTIDEKTLKAALKKYDSDGSKPNPRLV